MKSSISILLVYATIIYAKLLRNANHPKLTIINNNDIYNHRSDQFKTNIHFKGDNSFARQYGNIHYESKNEVFDEHSLRNGKVLGSFNTNNNRDSDFTKAYDHLDSDKERIMKYARVRRTVLDSKGYESNIVWLHTEVMDERGDFVLKWTASDNYISFRIEGKTKGYVGLGFNSLPKMEGADLIVAWVDDRNENGHLLDCHGLPRDGAVVADETQNYELIAGYQSETHTVIEFRRQLDTCDIQDYPIGDETIQVLWSLGADDSDGQLPKHQLKGSQDLRLLLPIAKPNKMFINSWNVTLTNISIPNRMATLFWCKIFKAPELPTKVHIVGYEPLIRNNATKMIPSPVHHMLLYECPEVAFEEKPIWNDWADGDGFFGPSMPREWASCFAPIAVWAIGSKGEYYPENVGIPMGGSSGALYYMLEVHYDNQALDDVLDSSGLSIKYSNVLRPHDAGILGSGIAVSALHLVVPRQKAYRTVGICTDHCTDTMLPKDGINIESVLLHAHTQATKIKLKHIRGDKELDVIAEENLYNTRYQKSKVIPGSRNVQKGDVLITECTYNTQSTNKPILGGYSEQQEMCLSFMVYWPRTPLVGCYSMSSAREFFQTFNVKKFYHMSMDDVENIFLASGTYDSFPQQISFDFMQQQNSRDNAMQGDDQGVGLLSSLMIQEPAEFQNKSFIAHLNELPWTEQLLTNNIQESLFKGPHTTVCKMMNNVLAIPIEIQNYPNYSELKSNSTSVSTCQYNMIESSVTNTRAYSHSTCVEYSTTLSMLSYFITLVLHR